MMLRLLSFAFAILAVGATPAHAVMDDYPSVKLQGLDKSTARTTTFEAKVGSTITYGPLFIRIQACRKAPPIERPESAAFVQIWEVPPETGKSEWVFSGWMFASSPALSAMDHAVYDIWVLDCTGRDDMAEQAPPAEDSASEKEEDKAADSEAAATDEEMPIDSEAQPDDPVDTGGASTQPESPAPGGAFDPAAPTPVPGAGPHGLSVDPDAPYVPAPLPGQGAIVPTPQAPAQDGYPYDPDAPYSPSRGYPPAP